MSMYEKVLLKRTDRLNAGHQWIFSNEIKTDFNTISPGSLVDVYNTKNNYLGTGYFNPHSLISIRLLTRQKEEINKEFFLKKIKDSLNYRHRLMHMRDSFRLVYSEGDFLPGVIADKYGDCLVIQILTLGMESHKGMLIEVFDDILSPSAIVLRNDSQSRKLEGLSSEIELIKGNLDSLPVIKEGEINFEINPLSGQKTGFFLDQAENRLTASRYIRGGRGLDIFCCSGAWGLHLAKKGAFVAFVDESEKALAQAGRNAELNGLEDKCSFVKEDAFNFLKKMLKTGSQYDFIILDPPAFVKSRTKIKEAIRGYIDLNSMAMKLLVKGGMLITSSCSHHIDKETFLDIIISAAQDAGRYARLLEYRSQSPDHPILLSVPETQYLKCAFITV